jgi:hypothetical protein
MRYIDLLESPNRYLPMFSWLYPAGIPQQVKNTIVDIETSMQRLDRTTWLMRWYRASLVAKSVKSSGNDPHYVSSWYPDLSTSTDAQEDKIKLRTIRDMGSYSWGTIVDDIEVYRINTSLLESFRHYFSLDIPAIQNFRFDKQRIGDVLVKFEQWENEWKESRSSIIDMNKHEAEKILDLGNEWAWFDLEKEYCEIEGDAMGHCGNGADWKQGDTVLSLRQHKKNNQWEPHLTFIRHADGFLGETKGRGNNKPVTKYHPAIFALLKSQYVNGITGGGYSPENNFSLTDLPDAWIKELKETKWGFCTYYELKEQSRWEDASRLIHTYLHSEKIDIKSYDEKSQTVVLEKYNSVTELLEMYFPWYKLWDVLEKFFDNNDATIPFRHLRQEYYQSFLNEHFLNVVNFTYDGIEVNWQSAEIYMHYDDFASAYEEAQNEHHFDISGFDHNYTSIENIEFNDPIDKLLLSCYYDLFGDMAFTTRTTAYSNDSLVNLLKISKKRWGKERDIGSPTIRDGNQLDFDFNS